MASTKENHRRQRILPRIDRRSFLKASGMGLAGSLLPPLGLVQRSEAEEAPKPPALKQVGSVCNFCAVGCGIVAEVQNGAWVSEEPMFDHPVSRGGLCAKGAAARGNVVSENRLKHPMKLEGGKWARISWDQALDEIAGKLLQIREEFGADAIQWLGSAHFSNEAEYMFRKLAALWGTNNADHQARICQTTSVAGAANTWGYGATTSNFNDIQNAKSIIIVGSNAAEAHPVSMQHILIARENGAKIIVVDPRFTRTAAKAHEYVRIRPGTDIAFLWGVVRAILENHWQDDVFINRRTYGIEYVRDMVRSYTPEFVERVSGVAPQQVNRVARILAENRPGTLIWCMGVTQHSNGHAVARANIVLQLLLGNVGRPGGSVNIFQSARALCVLSNSLPAFYGLSEGAWRHWAKVWGVDHDWLVGRFDSPEMMRKPGFTVSRWYEGVLLDPSELGQRCNLQAVTFWGISAECMTLMHRAKEAMEKIPLLVVVDPFPNTAAVLPEREDGVYLLPSCTAFEEEGSETNSSRQFAWRFKVIDPLFESRPDYDIMVGLANRLGIGEEFTRNIKEFPDDALLELERGALTIGIIGQTPERLRRQARNMHTFNPLTLKAEGGPCDGEYYGLPWPCWTEDHPGTPIHYDMSKPVTEGGLTFTARFGAEAPDGTSLLAAKGATLPGSTVDGGYPPFKGWNNDINVIKEALAKGMVPFGNGRARMYVWNLPDPVPLHREPINSPDPELQRICPSYKEDVPDHYRVPTKFASAQNPDNAAEYPLILTTGRWVQHQGGGSTTRSIKWLAELRPEPLLEIHPRTANEHGIREGDMVWVESPYKGKILVRAHVSKRVAAGTLFLPFHFGGQFLGRKYTDRYPDGMVPYAVGASANVVASYGYDRVTQMQEAKAGLCKIYKA